MPVAASHLIFGYFTAALIATAAVALAAGVQFLVIGWRQRRDPLYLSFTGLCVCLATLAFANALLSIATSLPQAILSLRILCAAAVLSFPALVMFVGYYTERPVKRMAFAIVCAVSAIFFWANLQLPYTVLDSSLRLGAPTILPWGESLSTVEGDPSLWGRAFRFIGGGVFVWAIYRAGWQYLYGQRVRGALLAACLLIQFGTYLWGAILVSMLSEPLPSLDAFAFLSFVLLMSLALAGQLHSRTLQLEQSTKELQAEADIRREAELDLRHAAYHDALTGLPNRLRAMHILSELLIEATDSGQHGAVLMIDLDNFKTINDSLGHHVGDRVLESIADNLLSGAPAAATVARLGGDEFVLLLRELDSHPELASARAMQIAQTMVTQLAKPLLIDNRMLGVGASIGIAMFPGDNATAADVVRCADIALYRAKSAGRNTARLFLPHMQREADARLDLERGLRTALERREFSLRFQPQMNMRGELAGAEALLRWTHPTLGEVSPARFIPLAEETGLIHALGAWVVGQVCDCIKQWQQLGLDFGGRISINVSPWEIAHPQFVEHIEAQVAGADIAPSQLTLELTESALLNDFATAQQTLRRLSAIGFRLALDDFGTGYSSLAYLQQLPLDELKIDQAFISALDPTSADPLAGFIIDVGSRLGITTIAEGVETWQQKVMLETLGCNILQGYFICRPLTEPDFRAWLAKLAASRAVAIRRARAATDDSRPLPGAQNPARESTR